MYKSLLQLALVYKCPSLLLPLAWGQQLQEEERFKIYSMEKLASSNFEVHGDVRPKLPVGFRFRPTDEELLVHYLARKVLSAPLPAPAVTELDVFQTEPYALPGDLRERRHFFSRIRSTMNTLHGRSDKKRVATGSGYWRSIGKEKQIMAVSSSNHQIGVRKSFAFHETRRGSDVAKKQWIMHELRLVVSLHRPLDSTLSGNHMIPREEDEGDWAVYRVFQKKRRTKRHRCKDLELLCVNNSITSSSSSSSMATVIDFKGEEDSSRLDPPPPSSPCSSLTIGHDSPFLVDEDEVISFYKK